MIRSSTNQTLSESCDTATVHTTSSVRTKPSTAINPSQISHSKQGEVNNVLYVNNTAVYCITMYVIYSVHSKTTHTNTHFNDINA